MHLLISVSYFSAVFPKVYTHKLLPNILETMNYVDSHGNANQEKVPTQG